MPCSLVENSWRVFKTTRRHILEEDTKTSDSMKGGELDYLASRPTIRFSRRVTSGSRNGILLTSYCLALHTRSNSTKLTMECTENACRPIRSVHINKQFMTFCIVSYSLSNLHVAYCHFCLPYTKCNTTAYWKRGACLISKKLPAEYEATLHAYILRQGLHKGTCRNCC